jgi:transcriptional regulator with XRE-family HTH domain
MHDIASLRCRAVPARVPSSACRNGFAQPTAAGSSLRWQIELAELVGTTQSAIARLERGGRPPRIDTLLRIADALDCELVVDLKPRG